MIRPSSPQAAKALARLRRLCLALPGTSERLSHGEPTWFVGAKKGRMFVMFSDHHHDDRLAFVCAAPDGAQEMLVAAEPDRFYLPPYVGGAGWVGVRLDVKVDWKEIAGLVAAAHHEAAGRVAGRR